MERKKENILSAHKRENDGSMCLCKEILWLKFQRLEAECQKVREQLRHHIAGSRNYQASLRHLIKLGNKRRAVTELYHEILDAEMRVQNMIEIPLDGERTVYRISENADRIRSCKNKVKHASETEAENAAHELAQRRDETYDFYKCRHCEFWHIGHFIAYNENQLHSKSIKEPLYSNRKAKA
jgi:hypothetical protein